MVKSNSYRFGLTGDGGKVLRTFGEELVMIREIVWLFACCAVTNAVYGEIQFDDVTVPSQLGRKSITFGASWGDFDGDGWPDLWVGNHYGNAPSLYLNQRNGEFLDIAPTVWSGNPLADTHGAAWGDFDNDGDQDLLELVGADYGKGKGENHFFVNENGELQEKAAEFGLANPLGRGRTPMWFDANRDGLLDILVVNMNRPDGKAASAVFIQENGRFSRIDAEVQSIPGNESFLEKAWRRSFRYARKIGLEGAWHRLDDWMRGRSGIECMQDSGFGTLTDFGPSGDIRLMVCSGPMRFFSVSADSFDETTDELSFPKFSDVQDVVLGDFTGDGQTDAYLVRGQHWVSQLLQTDPTNLKGFIVAGKRRAKEIRFSTDGELTVRLYGDFRPEQVHVEINGQVSKDLKNGVVTLKLPAQRRDFGDAIPTDPEKSATNAVFIRYDHSQDRWLLSSTLKSLRFDIESTRNISEVREAGFKSSVGARRDQLLVVLGSNAEPKMLPQFKEHSACYSGVAGDFDNDMDLDIYLVCSGPAGNLPNIIYENLSDQKWAKYLHDASHEGRGDSVAMADYDRDGFLDLAVTNGGGLYEGPMQLFRNKGNENHWIEIDLEGTSSNRDGTGAQIELKIGDRVQRRIQNGGMHRYSQNFRRIHFGLGQNDRIDYVKIWWPSGKVQTIENIAADQILQITEPQ